MSHMAHASGHLHRVSKLLGGKSVVGHDLDTPLDVVATVREGLPYRSLESLQGALKISTEELSKRLDIPRRTLVRRKEHGRLDSHESERILRLARVFARAVVLLGSVDKARSWLDQPNRAIGGAAPFDLLDTDVGAREVENVLGRIEHGVFS